MEMDGAHESDHLAQECICHKHWITKKQISESLR